MSSLLNGAAQAFPQGLYEDSSVQQARIGELAFAPDGRKFRYVKAGGTALVVGKLQQGPALVANHQNITVATAAIGATTLTVTLGATAATANQYAGGQICINAGTGVGQTYRIKSNPAANLSTDLVLTLEDPIVTAVATADSKACLYANKFNGVIVSPTTFTNSIVGVAIYPITASYYGWVQTGGQVACLNDSATAVGLAITRSASVAGSVKTGATTLDSIGVSCQAGVTTEYRFVELYID